MAIGAIGLAVPVLSASFAGLSDIGKLLGNAISGISLPMLGIGVAIAGLIVIGVLLYKNWDTIKAKATEILIVCLHQLRQRLIILKAILAA